MNHASKRSFRLTLLGVSMLFFALGFYGFRAAIRPGLAAPQPVRAQPVAESAVEAAAEERIQWVTVDDGLAERISGDPNERVRAVQGWTWFSVGAFGDGSATIEAGAAQVLAEHGVTRFGVHVADGTLRTIRCAEGIITLSFNGERRVLHAGETYEEADAPAPRLPRRPQTTSQDPAHPGMTSRRRRPAEPRTLDPWNAETTMTPAKVPPTQVVDPWAEERERPL